MAGVAAASKLNDYVIIEARDYIGGRLHTVPGPIELGAGWLHGCPDHNPLYKLCEENNIKSEYDDTEVVVYGPKGPVDKSIIEKIAPLWETYRHDKPEVSIAECIESFKTDNSSLSPEELDFLVNFAHFQKLPLGLEADTASSRYGGGLGRDRVVLDGYSQVLDVIGFDKSKVKLNEVVKSIEATDSGVEVTTNKQTYKGANVIVTAPVAVLKAGDIKFSKLPSEIEDAIDSTTPACLGKVYLEFPSKFWPENVDKFVITGKFPALAYNWGRVHKSTKNIISFLVINDACRKAESAKSIDEVFEVVKPLASAINSSGKDIPKPTWYKTTSWQEDPYSKGSFSTFKVGKDRVKAVSAFVKGAGRIQFAGEHTTLDGATFLHGAYLSGLRAADAVKNSKSSL